MYDIITDYNVLEWPNYCLYSFVNKVTKRICETPLCSTTPPNFLFSTLL